jgi:hypothetical protein
MEKQDAEKKTKAISGTLYVVFHGEVVFFDNGNQNDPIMAYAPEMDIHAYMAGPWLGEHWLQRGLELRLQGVKTGSASLKVRQDLTVMLYQASMPTKEMADESHMTIELPRPDDIFSGRRQDISKDKIVVKAPASYTIPEKDKCSALCTVFQYTIDSQTPPELRPVPCANETPWKSHLTTPGYYVLHVYAEADRLPGGAHVEMASRASAALVGVDLTLTVSPSKRARDGVTPRPGISAAEMRLTLAERMPYLTSIGLGVQSGNVDCLQWKPDYHLHTLIGTSQCGVLVAVPDSKKKIR